MPRVSVGLCAAVVLVTATTLPAHAHARANTHPDLIEHLPRLDKPATFDQYSGRLAAGGGDGGGDGDGGGANPK